LRADAGKGNNMVKTSKRKPIFTYPALLFEKEFPGKEYVISIRFCEYYYQGANIGDSLQVFY